MKLKNLVSVLLMIVAISFTSQANEMKDSLSSITCLEVIGIAVDEDNKPIDGVEVRLYKENEELEWTEITSVAYHEHSFIFNLAPNEYYTIEISKKGFVSRLVAISTKIPSNISLEEKFHYEFEVSLFKVKKQSDDYYLDFPVALISYNKERDVFDNNYAYTRHIKSMINQTVTIENEKKINRY